MQTDEVLELIQQVAAEVITPRFGTLEDSEIDEKRPGDLVTIADRESEQRLTAELSARVPGCVVVGEEAAFANPALLQGLDQIEHLFLVDPVDGTRNFARGRVEHAVMIAEVRQGTTTRAWIWQPALGHAFVAELGAGAYRDGERLPRREPVERSPLVRSSREKLIAADTGGALSMGMSNWCCGVDYPQVATGEADALLYVSNKPWDHAPGALLLAEVGGGVQTWTGTPYTAGNAEAGLLCYGHPDLVPTLTSALDLSARAAG